MLMQALRKGFLRVKKKRDLVGRGLPPVACSFFSFSFCFLFSSSSFMMTGFAGSPLVAIWKPPPETSFQGESTHRIIPNWGSDSPPLPITPLGSRPACPVHVPVPPSLSSSPHPLALCPSPQSQPSPRDSRPVTEKAPSAGEITAEGLEEQLALLWFKFRAWSTGRPCLGMGTLVGLQGWRVGDWRNEQKKSKRTIAVPLSYGSVVLSQQVRRIDAYYCIHLIWYM